MTVRKTRYVAASDINEAWNRFRAGLYTSEREDSIVRAEEMDADDSCEPPCKYTVYEVHVDIHVDEGPEREEDLPVRSIDFSGADLTGENHPCAGGCVC